MTDSFQEWLAKERDAHPDAERRAVPKRFIVRRPKSEQAEDLPWDENLPRVWQAIRQFYEVADT